MALSPLQPQQFRQEIARQAPLRRSVPVPVAQILTTATTLITAAADEDVLIESLWAGNISSSADSVSLYMVPDGGSPGTGNAVVTGYAVSANTVAELCGYWGPRFRLEPGYSLVATAATAGRINMGGWGYAIGGEA